MHLYEQSLCLRTKSQFRYSPYDGWEGGRSVTSSYSQTGS